MANLGQCAARLGRGDIVHEVLTRFATKQYLYPSFMMSYWPGLKGFGMDPVGTLPDIVNNSLIYAWEGTLDLLPALPEAWPVGSIQGILARGQLHIEKLAWDRPAGQVTLSLNSGVSQMLTVRLPESWSIATVDVMGDAEVEKVTDTGNHFTLKIHENSPVELILRFTTSR
jgi:alpha-L-fucosidase 2